MALAPEIAAVVRIENHIDQAVNEITAHIDRRAQEQQARADLLYDDLAHRIDQVARRQGLLWLYAVVAFAVVDVVAVVVAVALS